MSFSSSHPSRSSVANVVDVVVVFVVLFGVFEADRRDPAVRNVGSLAVPALVCRRRPFWRGGRAPSDCVGWEGCVGGRVWSRSWSMMKTNYLGGADF